MNLRFSITNRCKKYGFPRSELDKVITAICSRENVPVRQKIDIIFCGNRFMQKLNARYRGISRATDVISFAFNEPDFLGEIYISLPKAKMQAQRYGLGYNREILRLAAHGMFHLLGYDHETHEERRKMELKESKYCEI